MIQLLAYIVPSLVVLACVWLILHKVYKSEEQKRLWELKKLSQKEISPIRLRAYERLALVLERTQPEHMLMEMNELANMSVTQVQQHLLRQIRQEFDHNLSQQVYVSEELWDKILLSRDETASFVSAMAGRLPSNSTSLDYAKVLITAFHQNGETPHDIALRDLRNEMKTLL